MRILYLPIIMTMQLAGFRGDEKGNIKEIDFDTCKPD